MNQQLVVQLPVFEATNFDSLISVEDGMIQLFESNRDVLVDGHDIGMGKFNIFINTDESWAPIAGRIRAFLEFRGLLEDAIVAWRPSMTGQYNVVWPADYEGTFEL
jgi:hypothetical protein